MGILLLLFLFVVLFCGAIAYLSMKFFKRYTRKSSSHQILDALVFVLSFGLCFAAVVIIFFNTITFQR